MRFFHAGMVLLAVAVLLGGCGKGGEATTVGNGETAAAGKGAACWRTVEAKRGSKRLRPMREVRISLNRYVGPESAGILMAQERGYFAQAGLEVTVSDAAAPVGTIGYVLGKVVDFGVVQQPEVV